MTTIDFQAGGRNHHYGRIAHWLGGYLWSRRADIDVNIRVGTHYRELTAVGEGRAHLGVATPAMAARLAVLGQGTYGRVYPSLRSIGVVPHRDALVFGIAREMGLHGLDDVRRRRPPLRLLVPPESTLVGHAASRVLAAHGITRTLLESWGGRWIVTDTAQDALIMMLNGEAEALVNESVPQTFRPLSMRRPIELISFDPGVLDRLERMEGYGWKSLQAGTVEGQSQPVLGLNWDHWIVVAHAQVPDEIAYYLAEAFLNDAHRLERQYTADNRLKQEEISLEYPMDPEVVAHEVTVPLHQGAEIRYREAGILR